MWPFGRAARAARGGRAAEARAHPREGEAVAALFGLPNTVPQIVVTPETALRCPAVWAPLRLLADAVSILPLDVFAGAAADAAREKATSHAVYDLVHSRPNAWQTSAQFRRLMTERLLAWGNAYARVRDPGAPSALEPLHPARVRPFRDAAGAVWYRHTPASGPQAVLHPDEVLHLRYGPACDDDGLEAQSPLVVHRETVALAMAATDYLARFFANAATPRGLLEVPATLSPKASESIRESWERKYSGLENAHRLAVLDGGMKFTQLGMSNSDAQFLETYRAVSADISAKVFRVPPHMTGDTDRATSWGSGIEQQSIGFVTYCVGPLLDEWQQSLNAALFTAAARRRFFVEFNVDGLLRGDHKSRMEGFALMIQWGLATPNECRRKLNLPPLPGGDDRLQPLNMAPASRVMDVLLRDAGAARRALLGITGGATGDGDGD